jgi:tetratricopeptide (TPR) repeat protein
MDTRDRERLPTAEVPFPDAEGVEPAPADGPFETNPRVSAAHAAVAPAPAPPRPKTGNVAAPALRRSISPPLFLGIVALLLLVFVGSIFAIKRQYAKQVKVDVQAEAKHARERQLRNEAQQLLNQGRVDDAYAKYEELHKIAPNSSAVTQMLQRLSLIRQEKQATQQQIVQAGQKFDEGVALYNARKYDDAVKVFDESFRLNPARAETVNYLQLAQQQADRVRAEQLARQQQRTQVVQNNQRPTTTAAPPPLPPPAPVNNTPAQITTTFTHSFVDGTIVVKVGADVVARQPLWGETRVLHRREPRPVNVTTPVTPKNADVEIYIDVPALSIKERHVLARQNFAPGSARQLLVNFDKVSKQFNYQLN